MGEPHNRRWNKPRAFMGALLRDTRANTLALMAMAIIPLAGMVGGGIDISRMYIVKTRLQHACDAGALAGRKAMGGGTWSFGSYAARTAAEKFFDGNYNSAAYGVTSITRSFSENSGKVTGTATAVLPMTLMRIFGRTTESLTVTCDADMRLPNTDVMFVLDTTGSMNDYDGNGVRKIDGLKVAVKCFYEIVARLDTSATCTTGTPSGGTGNQVQIRFGFVPYATNVNVGRLLKTEWMADNWSYQTRQLVSGGPGGSVSGWGAWQSGGITACSSIPANNAATEYQITGSLWGYCSYNFRTWGTTTTGATTAMWKYDKLSLNVSGLKNGTDWNPSTDLQIGDNGVNKTLNWAGCIEERQTVQATSYTPIPSGAKDLDFDAVPTTDNTTKWGPSLPDALYTRQQTGNGTGNWNTAPVASTSTNYRNTAAVYCPTEAKKLQTWPSATGFDTYVDSLSPSGNTYHDIGLLWGARLASPTGLFASENDYTDQGGEIERHIIFMTDGDTNTSSSDYNAYGIPWFDKRQTNSTTQADLDTQVDLRFAALCQKIKNTTYNGRAAYTLWVISFGSVSTDTETRLTNCATSGRYFSALNSADLQSTFKSIADQISQLRLTR
ncbi:MAG: pilus assembly protein TadG [Sphingomonadales bacterium]|nr:MAG: pilus assembly protein TadG [Sphingomonadales bacterium]